MWGIQGTTEVYCEFHDGYEEDMTACLSSIYLDALEDLCRVYDISLFCFVKDEGWDFYIEGIQEQNKRFVDALYRKRNKINLWDFYSRMECLDNDIEKRKELGITLDSNKILVMFKDNDMLWKMLESLVKLIKSENYYYKLSICECVGIVN